MSKKIREQALLLDRRTTPFVSPTWSSAVLYWTRELAHIWLSSSRNPASEPQTRCFSADEPAPLEALKTPDPSEEWHGELTKDCPKRVQSVIVKR